MKKRICVSLILVAVFSGCSDPKQANEANFTRAVQAFMDKSLYPYCYFTGKFPMNSNGFNDNQLQALVKVGFLSEKELDSKVNNHEFKLVPVKEYDLTEEGRKQYKTEMGVGGFCFGKLKVTSIDKFTEPSDFDGIKRSRVSFSFSVYEIPEWAKNNVEVQSSNKDLKAAIDSEKVPIKGETNMMLTNKGWELQKGWQ